jgi:hypothetical protein
MGCGAKFAGSAGYRITKKLRLLNMNKLAQSLVLALMVASLAPPGAAQQQQRVAPYGGYAQQPGGVPSNYAVYPLPAMSVDTEQGYRSTMAALDAWLRSVSSRYPNDALSRYRVRQDYGRLVTEMNSRRLVALQQTDENRVAALTRQVAALTAQNRQLTQQNSTLRAQSMRQSAEITTLREQLLDKQ